MSPKHNSDAVVKRLHTLHKTPSLEVTNRKKEGQRLTHEAARWAAFYRPIFLWVGCVALVTVCIGVAVGVPVGLHIAKENKSNDSNLLSSVPQSLNATVAADVWKPKNGTTWQIVLLNAVQANRTTAGSIAIWDFDLFDNSAAIISNFHEIDQKVVCYFSAGSYENWRPDASDFLPSDLGSNLDGWPGERWLNTNSTNVRNIMLARMDLAVTKKCDGVDPDNVDGYDNDNGLGLTEADAVNYVGFLADAAHSRKLSIGLKNAGAIVPNVIDQMQWSVQEQCVEYDECDLYQPFIHQGKPVFHIEYPKGDGTSNELPVTPAQKAQACDGDQEEGFSTIIKNINLDLWFESC